MIEVESLLDLAGPGQAPDRVSVAALVLLDFQTEYKSGPIAVAARDAGQVRQ